MDKLYVDPSNLLNRRLLEEKEATSTSHELSTLLQGNILFSYTSHYTVVFILNSSIFASLGVSKLLSHSVYIR
jgi:hypothetical protein